MNTENNNLTCPLSNKPCIGKGCACAVRLDHYNVSTMGIIYYCGLINTYDIYNHGEPHILDFTPYNSEV